MVHKIIKALLEPWGRPVSECLLVNQIRNLQMGRSEECHSKDQPLRLYTQKNDEKTKNT